MLKINPVNTIDYMDRDPIEADYIASRYNEYIAKEEQYYYLASIDKDNKTEDINKYSASVNEIVACQFGYLLGHAGDETESRMNGAIRAIERAADAGKPYRLPGDTIAYYPDGTSILLHWSER